MKLLFDENLPPKLTRLLSETFPGCVHVRECGLLGAGDKEVWDFAALNGCIILTKDSDFQQRSLLFGAPPKVVWLRIGNCTTEQIIRLLQKNEAALAKLANDPSESIAVIG